MQTLKALQRFSKFSERLNRVRTKTLDTNEESSLETTAYSPPSNDMNSIIRNTPDSVIYRNQPAEDTINSREIAFSDPFFYQSRNDEKLKFKISGEESQIAIIDIYPGEKVRSESDKIIYMTEGVEMDTHSAGGVSSMFKRFIGGSSLFLTDYSYTETEGFGRVAFAETFPSKIIPIRLDDYGGSINCKKGTYICGSPDVEMNIAFSKKFTTGFFGGEGFVLQNLSSQVPGQTALLRAGGSIIKRSLRQGEKLKVAPGMIVAFSPSIAYNIELASTKLMNVLFGGQRSMFIATFTGPGDLYLQSLSFENLIQEIVARIPSRGGGSHSSSSSTGNDKDEPEEEAEAEEEEK